jgi:hypothetical protein
MISNGPSRPSRSSPRRPVPGGVEATVILCGSTVCRARIVDEQGGSLGLLVKGADAERAAAHQTCCLRQTILLRVPGEDAETREVPAQLVHVSPETGSTKVGVGFLVSCLNAQDVQHLLGLWRRLREGAEPA